VEPSDVPKLPTGQAASGYLREHKGSIATGRCPQIHTGASPAI
jgi:hypothetical protein